MLLSCSALGSKDVVIAILFIHVWSFRIHRFLGSTVPDGKGFACIFVCFKVEFPTEDLVVGIMKFSGRIAANGNMIYLAVIIKKEFRIAVSRKTKYRIAPFSRGIIVCDIITASVCAMKGVYDIEFTVVITKGRSECSSAETRIGKIKL